MKEGSIVVEEKKVNSGLKTVRGGIMIVIILSLITSIYAVRILTQEKTRLLIDNEQLEKSKLVFFSKLVACIEEHDNMKTRMEGIKNNDDLLCRDIFLYIDKNYRTVPNIIATTIAEQVLILSKKEDVSSELVVGIIEVESSFNPMAISKAKARGLMQVMPAWAKKFEISLTNLHDIDTGIEIGIKVLKIHIQENKGNINQGLYHYVGKDKTYASKVFEAMGKFVAFRSTVDDEVVDVDKPKENKQPEKESPL